MSWVYIVESLPTRKYYIGCTDNYERRIHEHETGKVRSTKYLRPLKLCLVQKYDTLQKARKVEFKLKNLKRKDYIEKIIKDGFIRMRA